MVNSSLRIVGVESGKAEIRLYNILGSPIFISSFQGNGINNFSLPNINTGVYIVHLTAEKGMLNRKIIIEQNN